MDTPKWMEMESHTQAKSYIISECLTISQNACIIIKRHERKSSLRTILRELSKGPLLLLF